MSMIVCNACGGTINDAAPYCPHCGAPQAPGELTPQGAWAAHRWSGFWRRVGASWIDGLVLAIPMWVVTFAATLALAFMHLPPMQLLGLSYLLVLGTAVLYQAVLNSSSGSATWGRRAVGIAMVDAATGETLGFGRAAARALVSFLSGFFVLPQLVQLFTPRRQSLADLICGTTVVARKPGRSSALIIVLAVVGVAIPIVGIMAAIAIPAYQDYTVRARVAGGMAASMPFEAVVAKNAAIGASDLSAGVPTTFVAKGVEGIDVSADGAITVTMMPPPRNGLQFTLTPFDNRGAVKAGQPAAGAIHWRCKVSSQQMDRYVPIECRI